MKDSKQDRKTKQLWMKEHGYTLLGGIYDIQIAIVDHAGNEGQTATLKHMVSAEKVYDMTIEELVIYDQNVWLKARQEIAELIAMKNRNRGAK